MPLLVSMASIVTVCPGVGFAGLGVKTRLKLEMTEISTLLLCKGGLSDSALSMVELHLAV